MVMTQATTIERATPQRTALVRLAAPTPTIAPLTAQSSGVVKLAPKTAAAAGKNATVALFAYNYLSARIALRRGPRPGS